MSPNFADGNDNLTFGYVSRKNNPYKLIGLTGLKMIENGDDYNYLQVMMTILFMKSPSSEKKMFSYFIHFSRCLFLIVRLGAVASKKATPF